MSKYIAGTDGAVEMVHIPPHTPQLNPIEMEWREIRAAITYIFFGGLDRMQDAIIRMFHNGEIPIVKMSDRLLSRPWLARPLSEGTRSAPHLPDYCALPHVRFIQRRRIGAGSGGKGRLDCSMVLTRTAGDTRTIWVVMAIKFAKTRGHQKV